MSFCSNCGSEVKDYYKVCPNCGYKLVRSQPVPEDEMNTRQNQTASPSFDSMKTAADSVKNAARDTVKKTINEAQNLANQAGQKLDGFSIPNPMKPQGTMDSVTPPPAPGTQNSTRFMSSTELWSWLKQNSKRQLFFEEEPQSLSEAEFMNAVQQKMNDNSVPARIEQKTIQWDRTSYTKTNFYVQPFTEVVNPLSCILQFNRVGKFSFVEEKSFITPPDLPEVPEKPKPISETLARAAAVFSALGFLLLMVSANFNSYYSSSLKTGGLLFGIIFLAVGIILFYQIHTLKEHNRKCALQLLKWNKAWNDWENSIFAYSFQEDINGQLSRIFDSVFECVKQVNADLFDSKGEEEEESSNMNELEQLIKRRKEEYR